MITCGVDSVDIKRIEKSLLINGFLEKIYSAEEIAYIKSKRNMAETAAGHFAAKEAFLKAAGVGIVSFKLNEIGITHTEKGAPVFSLSGFAEELLKGKSASLSITHTEETATAFVIFYDEKESK